MAQTADLLELFCRDLGPLGRVRQARMFGGIALMLDGRLLVAVHGDHVLCRVGGAGMAAAPDWPGIAPARMGARVMAGYVTLPLAALQDAALRRQVIACARAAAAQSGPRPVAKRR